MAFETQTIDLPCRHCGAQHKVKWHRMPVREPYRLVCRACGEVMEQGKSVRDFEKPRLVAR
jgi:uncharacterized Zn finger protein